MSPIIRSVAAVLAGMIACFFLILAVQMISQRIYPPPDWLNVKDPEALAKQMNDPETMAKLMKSLPLGALILVPISWALGTFIGAGIAARVAPTWKIGHGMIIGVLYLMSAIGQMSMFPHPTWLWVVGVAEFLPIAYLGAKLNSNTIAHAPPVEIEA